MQKNSRNKPIDLSLLISLLSLICGILSLFRDTIDFTLPWSPVFGSVALGIGIATPLAWALFKFLSLPARLAKRARLVWAALWEFRAFLILTSIARAVLFVVIVTVIGRLALSFREPADRSPDAFRLLIADFVCDSNQLCAEGEQLAQVVHRYISARISLPDLSERFEIERTEAVTDKEPAEDAAEKHAAQMVVWGTMLIPTSLQELLFLPSFTFRPEVQEWIDVDPQWFGVPIGHTELRGLSQRISARVETAAVYALAAAYLAERSIDTYSEAVSLLDSAIDNTKHELNALEPDAQTDRRLFEQTLGVFYDAKGRACLALERTACACESYLHALEYTPNLLRARIGLGDCLVASKEPDLARDEYEKARGIDSRSYRAQNGLARVALQQGDLDTAEEWFLRANHWAGEQDTDFIAAQFFLGWIYADTDHHRRARAYFKPIASNPHVPQEIRDVASTYLVSRQVPALDALPKSYAMLLQEELPTPVAPAPTPTSTSTRPPTSTPAPTPTHTPTRPPTRTPTGTPRGAPAATATAAAFIAPTSSPTPVPTVAVPGKRLVARESAGIYVRPENNPHDPLGEIEPGESVDVIGQAVAPWIHWMYVSREQDGLQGYVWQPFFNWEPIAVNSVEAYSFCDQEVKSAGLKVWVQGGDGHYTFWWEDQRVDAVEEEPGRFIVSWRWGDIVNVGRLEVRSRDGQTVYAGDQFVQMPSCK